MASPTVSEPQFLAARRERAAALAETLELPSFKGTPGWEFTDLSGLDIDELARLIASYLNGSAAHKFQAMTAGETLKIYCFER